jgi:serine phosphatase RsbU (regulator of sigma subunit)
MKLSTRRAWLSLLGLIGFTIAGVSLADMFVRRPSDGIVPFPYGAEGIVVREVASGSGAEQAGIRPGDHVVGIGRRMVRTTADASRELLKCRIGERASYLVERGKNNVFTASVSLSASRLAGTTYLYEAMIGLLFFAIGAFVFLQRPDDDAVALFFILCVLFLLFFVCRLRPSSYWWIDLFVQNTGTVSLFLLPAVFLHFFLVFPRPKRLRFADAAVEAGEPPARLAAHLQAFLNGSPLLYTLIYAVPPVVYLAVLRRQLQGKPVVLLSGAPLASWVLLGDYLVLGLAALAHSAFTLENPRERRQVREVFLGTIAGTVPFVVFGIIFPTAFRNEALVFSGIAPMILIPLTFAYAIVRFQLLNVRVIVRKSILYTATTALVFALYAGTIAAANELFKGSRLSSSRVFMFGFFLVVIPLFEFLRRRLQTPIDKLFFRDKYDYQRALLEMSEAVAGQLDLARVTDYLTAKLVSAMRLSTAELYLAQRDGSFASPERRQERIAADDPLLPTLRAAGGPLSISELRSRAGRMSPSARSIFEVGGFKLFVPVVYRERLMAFLALGGKLSEESFDREDRLLLETLANQAATAIETASLHDEMTQQAEFRRDLEIARDIQTSLFPKEFPKVPGVRFAGGSIPARVVGGDFYDFLPLRNGSAGVGFVMGDVSGKSIPASLLMVASREILYAGSRGIDDPGLLFQESNRRIYDIKRKMFVALGYFVLEPVSMSMRYAIGGQPLPILLRDGNGGPRPIEPPTYRLPLGALRDVPYDTCEVYLRPGDLLFFYTDGFTEAMDLQMEPFGEERLMESLTRHAGPDLDAIARGVLADVRRHVGEAEQYDDMTFLLMRVGRIGEEDR